MKYKIIKFLSNILECNITRCSWCYKHKLDKYVIFLNINELVCRTCYIEPWKSGR